ncbi:DNA polymerase epsilon noncatalytic subunit [Saccharomycopsis crataegensis]|uniref:DNA polymerase epsilon subunit B n=1 Tax=Saccharomycopsis crataegensis TaxID=43959 RepID=A0AAV5QHP7_9ASCO|nr:DNA polymerase epsilon noncatalytic subunit [Saccharomycopsis crataegensis]
MEPIPLQIKLKPSHLRPIAYRILSKKHGLHVKSDALEVLTEYIGSTFGSQWKSQESLKFIEDIAKSWKAKFQANKNLFIDGENLKTIIKDINEKKNVTNAKPSGGAQSSLSNFLSKNDDAPMANKTDTLIDIDELMEDRPTTIKRMKLSEYFQVKDFYELPIARFNHSRKKYEPYLPPHDRMQAETNLIKKLSSDFNVQDNLSIYISRYHQVYHKILRNESFHFSSALNPTSSTYFDELQLLSISDEFSKLKSINEEVKQIMLIKNLLGRHGKQFIIFGLLTKNNEGKYKLQDSSDSIELDLENAYPDESFFYFEGCLLICDGIYINFGGKSKFVVNLIYHPKAESREDFFRNFGVIDFQSNNLDIKNPKSIREFDQYQEKLIADSRLKLQESEDAGSLGLDRIIFIGSEIFLDSLKTLDYLKKLFSQITKDINDLPIAIVFPGSFLSRSFETSSVNSLGDNSSMNYKHLFDSLAVILSNFPTLCAKTQFIFTAGYNDPWSSLVYQGSKSVAMPFNRIPKLFFNRLSKIVKNLKIVTNPFKMFYLNTEINLINDDIYERMVKNDIPFNFYGEKVEMMRNLDSESNNNVEKIVEDIEDDDDDDEERRISRALLSTKISSMNNLNINSLRKQILKPSDSRAFKKDVNKLTNTLIHQSHMSPFAIATRPVVWKFDSLMAMNPLPNTLILFDSTIGFFNEMVNGVRVINIGKFINNDNKAANYVEYYPASQKAEWKKIYFSG